MKNTWKQTRHILAFEKSLQLRKVSTPPSKTICVDMEQFVLVPASVYNNKYLKTQTVTKQKLPKYQDEQNPRCQTDSLKKKTNDLFDKADSLSKKLLSCLRFKLPKFADFKNRWCENGNFAFSFCSTTSS